MATKYCVIPPANSFSPEDIAKICNLSRPTIIKWTTRGIPPDHSFTLPCTKGALNGARRIKREDLINFLNKAGYEMELLPAPAEVVIAIDPPSVAPVVVTESSKITLRYFFEKEYWPRKTRGRSAGNRKLYGLALNSFAKFLGREPTLGDLDDDTLVIWIHWHTDRGRAAATTNRNLSSVKALWQFAAKRRFVTNFPTVELLREPKRTPVAWNAEQVRALFSSADCTPGMIGEVDARIWWSALLQIIWWSAERIGAVLQLKWSDVDLDAGYMVFRAETRKGGSSDMRHMLPAEAVALLSRFKRQPDDLVFRWPKTLESLFDSFGRILKSAGLPHGRRDKFHRIRRTVASFITAAGGNASLALGHSSQEITQRNYLDPIICGVRGPAALLFSPTEERKKGGATNAK